MMSRSSQAKLKKVSDALEALGFACQSHGHSFVVSEYVHTTSISPGTVESCAFVAKIPLKGKGLLIAYVGSLDTEDLLRLCPAADRKHFKGAVARVFFRKGKRTEKILVLHTYRELSDNVAVALAAYL